MSCLPSVLAIVAGYMGVAIQPHVPLPALRLESKTPLVDFQKAIEKQLGFRPDAVSNYYSIRTNEIYLIDDPAYYRKLNRTLDASLAHELAHYLQVTYLRANIEDPNQTDSWEMQAIDVQQRMEDTVKRTGSICSR